MPNDSADFLRSIISQAIGEQYAQKRQQAQFAQEMLLRQAPPTTYEQIQLDRQAQEQAANEAFRQQQLGYTKQQRDLAERTAQQEQEARDRTYNLQSQEALGRLFGQGFQTAPALEKGVNPAQMGEINIGGTFLRPPRAGEKPGEVALDLSKLPKEMQNLLTPGQGPVGITIPELKSISEGIVPKPMTSAEMDAKQQMLMTQVMKENPLSVGSALDLNAQDKAIEKSSLSPEDKAFLRARTMIKTSPGTTNLIGENRMAALGNIRWYTVYDGANGTIHTISANQLKDEPDPQRYAFAAQAIPLKTKESIFQDMEYNIGLARKAISSLKDLDTSTRGQLILALDTEDKGIVGKFLTGVIGQKMTPEQREAAQSLAVLRENAMALRQVAGFGPGSDELRRIIQETLPSGKSPDINYMLGQLDKFEQVEKRLKGPVYMLPGSTPPPATPGEQAPPPPSINDVAQQLLQQLKNVPTGGKK